LLPGIVLLRLFDTNLLTEGCNRKRGGIRGVLEKISVRGAEQKWAAKKAFLFLEILQRTGKKLP
jgi:hypothetical protein